MKNAPVYILLILFLCTAGLYSAEINDTKDSTKLLEPAPKDKRIELIAIGGIGVAYSVFDVYWNKMFYSFVPTMAFGIELPFTKSHFWSIELYTHWWAAKKKPDNTVYNYYEPYIQMSQNIYSQIGTSAVLKLYFGKKKSNIRFSFHGGYMLSPSSDYSGMDFGFSIYYYLYDNLSISMNNRFFLGRFNVQGSSTTYAPNLLMFNLNYKFKL